MVRKSRNLFPNPMDNLYQAMAFECSLCRRMSREDQRGGLGSGCHELHPHDPRSGYTVWTSGGANGCRDGPDSGAGLRSSSADVPRPEMPGRRCRAPLF